MKAVSLVVHAASLLGMSSAVAQVLVFGLPLGGKLTKQPPPCQDDATQTKVLCWVDKPHTSRHGKSGLVAIPDTSLPGWARHQLPQMSLNGDGDLASLRFSGKALEHRATDIVHSVSGRFGKPVNEFTQGDVRVSEWRSQGISIKLGCVRYEGCFIDFISEEAAREKAVQRAENQERERARPVSP